MQPQKMGICLRRFAWLWQNASKIYKSCELEWILDEKQTIQTQTTVRFVGYLFGFNMLYSYL